MNGLADHHRFKLIYSFDVFSAGDFVPLYEMFELLEITDAM